MLAKAIALAAEAFKNTTDKGGKPYILHCLRVMNSVSHLGEEVMTAAVLHDVPEDTAITVEELLLLGYSQRVCLLVNLLTHREGVPYDDYIKAIALDKDATAIKKADLIDNSSITRIKALRKKDFDRLEKYHRAYVYLSN